MEDHYIIYGIGNDDQIKKLVDTLEEVEISHEFRDFRDFPPSHDQLEEWAEFEGDDLPINIRSNFYKKNKKKFDKLSDREKKDWLIKNYILISRPIILNENEEILSIGGRPERLFKTVFGLVQDFE